MTGGARFFWRELGRASLISAIATLIGLLVALLLAACQSTTQRRAHELASQCATDREWLGNEAIRARCQALGEAMAGGEGCSFPCRVDEAKVREAVGELERVAKEEGVR